MRPPLSHLWATMVGSGQLVLPRSRCSLQLHRWRGEGGVCTWLVLRVPRQYISTQTGLLGQAEMATVATWESESATTGTWEAES